MRDFCGWIINLEQVDEFVFTNMIYSEANIEGIRLSVRSEKMSRSLQSSTAGEIVEGEV